MWKTTLSHATITTNNNHQTFFTRLIIFPVLELVVCLLPVVWRGDSAEGEDWDQHCPDWRLQHPALQSGRGGRGGRGGQ